MDAIVDWIGTKAQGMPYIVAAGGCRDSANRLYLWNAEVSSAFMGPIGCLERTLRHASQGALADAFGSDAWWERAELAPRHLRMVSQAALTARSGAGPVPSSQVVSRLDFRFWVDLISKRYHVRLWNPALSRILVGGSASLRRRDFHAALTRALLLRDAIEADEPLIGRDLAHDYNALLRALGGISPSAGLAVESMSRIPEVLARRGAVVDGLVPARI